MRILRLDSWDGSPGGAQDYVREVTSELKARGVDARVLQITDHPGGIPPPVGETLPRGRGGLVRLGEDTVPGGHVARALRREIRSYTPDIIHLHHFDAGFQDIASVLRATEIPIVFTGHDAELVCPISTLVRPGNVVCEGGVRLRCLFTGCHVGLGGPLNLWQTRVFDRFLRDRVRAYLCPSRSLTDYLHAHGYRPAVHLPSFARIPAEVRARPTPPPDPGVPLTIGYLGRLEWYKGVDILIRAVARLSADMPGVRLDIAGTGGECEALKNLARRLGLQDRVQFRGHVSGPAKEAWFQGVHVTAMPSTMWENFGLVALEALVRGRPVVGSRIGGIPEIIDEGVSGFLVPIADEKALADRLARFVHAPDLVERFGAAGRVQVLERFTPEVHLDRLEAVYRAVLAGRPLRSGGDADEVRSAGPARGATPWSGVPVGGGTRRAFEPESQARQT